MPERKYLIILLFLVGCIYVCFSEAQTVSPLEKKGRSVSLKEQLNADIRLIELNQYVNIDTAFVILNKAKLLAERTDDKTKFIELYIAESELLCRTGKLELALAYANTAKVKAEEIDRENYLADSYLAIAGVYINLDDYEEAYNYCLTAEAMLGRLGNDDGLRKCYSYMGSIHNRTGNVEKATFYFGKALQYAGKSGNDIFTAIACNNLGIVLCRDRKFEESKKYLNQAVRLCEQNNYNTILVTAYINLANFMLNAGKSQEAIAYCDKALSIARKFDLKDALLRVYFITGRYYYLREEYTHSIVNAVKALRLSIDSKAYNEVIMSSVLLSDNYRSVNKPDSALFYLNYALIYKDSLNVRNNANNLIKLQYEYENKEQEQNAKLRMIQIALWISLFVLILILITGTFILKARKKQIKIFELEAKSAEMEQELGCRNRELTSKLMYINSNNHLIESLVAKLTKVKENSNEDDTRNLNEVIAEFKSLMSSGSLKEFELRFNEVNPEFMKRLLDRFPNLTSNEKNLCAYLKLNMSTKEIASLLHVSVNAVIIARYRLRKKMKINNTDIPITKFLNEL